MHIFYSYFRCTDVLFLGCTLSVAIRASWETKKEENLSYEKNFIGEFMWGKSLFWLHALLSFSFIVSFFIHSFPLPKWRTCWMATLKIHNIATINCIIFWDFFMFYQTFLSPQVKRCAIITYKHGVYELPHELPNDLRLRNYQELSEIRKYQESAQTP